MDTYPLYPALPEDGASEAQALVEQFKAALSKAATEVIGQLYCDIVPHIESDSWTNYRNHLMDGFKDYRNRKIQGEFDFKEIRKAIYEEYREELIVDLNQDMVTEINELKDQNKFLQNCLRER